MGVLDFDMTETGVHDVVVELLSGTDLSVTLIRSGPFELEQAIDGGCTLCQPLQYVDDRGLMHRNLKPSNIWAVDETLDGRVTVKRLDFGVAGLWDMLRQKRVSPHRTRRPSPSRVRSITGRLSSVTAMHLTGAAMCMPSDVFCGRCVLDVRCTMGIRRSRSCRGI